ncbi:MAG: PucR family transcriptional regulator [Proteocatella sp.]
MPVIGISVKELLELEIMEGAKVIAGASGINRVIAKLNIMEVPDIINWVSKGEFILTTAYSLKDNVDLLTDIIYEFNKKQVAGVAIKTQRYITQVPKETLEVADEEGIPIIEIPYNVAFSTIISQVSEYIVSKQIATFQSLNKINNDLFMIMVNGGKTQDVLLKIHELLNKNTISITDYILDEKIIISKRNEDKYLYDDILTVEKRKFTKNYHENEFVGDNSIYTRYDMINGEKIKRHCIHVIIKGYPHATINIWEDESEINNIYLKVLESASTLIALQITNRLSILEIESNHKLEFIENLLSLNIEKYNKAIEKERMFNFNHKAENAVVLIKFKSENNKNASNIFFNKEIRLSNAIDKLSRSLELNVLTGVKDHYILLVVGSKTEYDSKQEKFEIQLNKFCSELIYKANNYGIHEDFDVGASKTYINSIDIGKGYREALNCIDYLKYKNTRLMHFKNLGIYKILTNESIENELVDMYKDYIYELRKYDKDKNTNLVDTLKKYFEHSGNVKKISEDMYSHYNTIVYRVSRIKEILKIDFDNYEEMLNVQIALKVLDLMGDDKIELFVNNH